MNLNKENLVIHILKLEAHSILVNVNPIHCDPFIILNKEPSGCACVFR